MRKSSANTEVREAGERGGGVAVQAEISLQPRERRACWSRYQHCSPMEDFTPEQENILPRKSSCWSSLILKDGLLGRAHSGAVLEGLQTVDRTHRGAGDKCDKEVAKMNCCGWITALFPSTLRCLGLLQRNQNFLSWKRPLKVMRKKWVGGRCCFFFINFFVFAPHSSKLF